MAKKAKKSATAKGKKPALKVGLKPIADAIDEAIKEFETVSEFVDQAEKQAIRGKIRKLKEIRRELPCRALAGYPL